jgi:hypothetical protein
MLNDFDYVNKLEEIRYKLLPKLLLFLQVLIKKCLLQTFLHEKLTKSAKKRVFLKDFVEILIGIKVFKYLLEQDPNYKDRVIQNYKV